MTSARNFRRCCCPTILADGLYAEGRRTIRGALLRLYRHLGGSTEAPIGRAFVAHAGSLLLLDGILPDDLTLPKLVKVLCTGKAHSRICAAWGAGP